MIVVIWSETLSVNSDLLLLVVWHGEGSCYQIYNLPASIPCRPYGKMNESITLLSQVNAQSTEILTGYLIFITFDRCLGNTATVVLCVHHRLVLELPARMPRSTA